MTVQPTTGATQPQAAQQAYPSVWTGGTTAASAGNDKLGQDAFLKLLVAQLKYQDPMNPVQGADFIAQTAQFTVVEKLEEMSKQNAEALVSQRLSQASTLVGKSVSYAASDGTAKTGTVTAVKIVNSAPVLVIGKDEVALAAVTEVTTPPVVAPAPAAAAGTAATSADSGSTTNSASSGAGSTTTTSGSSGAGSTTTSGSSTDATTPSQGSTEATTPTTSGSAPAAG